MKRNRLLLKLSFLSMLFITVVVSCKKDDDPTPEYDYFVSKELAYSYDQEYIRSLLGLFSDTLPEVAGMRSLVISDISTYKIIYNTEIKGTDTQASGLVCIPTKPGNYPVLSFQNGTNTVNANAPTMAPLNYQLIGLVASMGFVVVVADYPGFGETAQLPHPYLVKEPMVRSVIDLLKAVNELPGTELPDLEIKNEYYLLGYSLGGWATLALHKELELNQNEMELKGSMCGAGPYNISLLLENMVGRETYHMPSYLGYILHAYSSYEQFTNPLTDIFNEPYATRVNTLFNGVLGLSQINSQLTTSIPGLLTPEFLTGFQTAPKFAPVRQAFINNSIPPWKTMKPLLLIHGSGDTQVAPISTEDIYTGLIGAGSSPQTVTKLIVPGDHGDAAVPAMVKGILFFLDLRDSE